MTDQDSHKHQQALTPQEAAKLLRELADQLEQGVLTLDQQRISLEHALVLEQYLKPEDEGLAYKLKLKYKPAAGQGHEASNATASPGQPGAAATASPPATPDFKALKRSLSGPFKQVKASLAQGGLPQAELVDGLWRSCHLLLEQTGGQDQGFVELERQADILRQATRAGDVALADQACQAMARVKSQCHAARK